MKSIPVMTRENNHSEESVLHDPDPVTGPSETLDHDGEPDGHALIDVCLSLSHFYNSYEYEPSDHRKS